MQKEIRQLEPIAVWNRFADLNEVPRPSKKEERVIAFMLAFGKSLDLETLEDEIGNVIIRKPATKGMEDCKIVTLQSHLDMVHQKNSDTDFDFDTQGIQMYIEDGWVKAEGTTLGADNGMGVAAIMALLESTDIPHPPLEALFTIDEETGMTGALGLKGGILQGEILLNLDTEEDDEIGIGCAGGVDVTARAIYKEETPLENTASYSLVVKGLRGGHSGMDIHRGFGNANKIMNRLLQEATKGYCIQVATINGGSLRNAIPRESSAIIVVTSDKKENFEKELKVWIAAIKNELSTTEPNLVVELNITEIPKTVMTAEAQDKLLRAIRAAINGVYCMSAVVKGLVETSNNVARVVVADGSIRVACLTRSSVDSAKWDLGHSLQSVFELAGYDVVLDNDYPGWEPNPDSSIAKVLVAQYKTLFKETPKVAACHAGLECGILGTNYPDMDMISFGPIIKGAHSPDERVNIASVQKFWKFTLETLKNSPKK
ncbi:MAG: aminoacyl-histidine dipeptidase [Cellulophaga sp.]